MIIVFGVILFFVGMLKYIQFYVSVADISDELNRENIENVGFLIPFKGLNAFRLASNATFMYGIFKGQLNTVKPDKIKNLVMKCKSQYSQGIIISIIGAGLIVFGNELRLSAI